MDERQCSGSDSTYHLERARTELDLAYRAEQSAAASAHMRLSALHMKKALLSKSGSEKGDADADR